ncbi:hypothetical protein [Methylocucumis oryzae]|uniref:Uncharacterized protein n=1 Tax=Methylocucumis oryzae TaxID=1632867 RepID=A0A0F3IGU2_9GAMM|nr:hypothetical protein [Methylocucumis oryzae]KJV06020.1 hypothetical protein VZ94_14095 [Methylocucumis oryzae]
MLKKLLLATVCAASLSAAFEVFAIDKAIKAVSGEIGCYGNHNEDSVSSTIFRNFDPKKSISITKITVYKSDGSLMQELSPAGFPSGFNEIMVPFSANTLSTSTLFPGQNPGRLTFRINFKSTDGSPALAPYINSALYYYTSSSKTSLSTSSTFECIYTSLSSK